MADFQGLSDSIITGDAPRAKELTIEAVEEGIDPKVILDEGMIPGMAVVGERFRKNEIYVPEVLISARAMKTAMQIIRPLLTETGVEAVGSAVLGTVKGDLHDIGKNLVGMMMEGAGITVVNLGVDVQIDQWIEYVEEHKPDILGMSALLTTTMPGMADVIEALEEEDLRDDIIVMIGGAPVTQSFADEIGADGYAPDAASAVDKAKELLGVTAKQESS